MKGDELIYKASRASSDKRVHDDDNVSVSYFSSRFMTVSTITFPISANMTGDTLTCEATHEAESVSRTVSTELSVEYAPLVSINTIHQDIYEGDSVKFSCSASAFPELIEYHWKIDEEEIKEGRGAKEVVIVVDRGFNKKRVTCFARNSIGENMDSYNLDVKCKWEIQFLSSPRALINCWVSW